MKYLVLIVLSVFFLNCKQEKTEELSAQSIIDSSIEVSGGKQIAASEIGFTFRDIHYKAKRLNGAYALIRKQNKGKDWIIDSLTNTDFKRSVNNTSVEVPDSMVTRYSASVNSVHYFSVLPYGLNDQAVNKKRLEDFSIKGKNYYAIQVTFDPNGGGEDFEDVFIYWINKATEKVDYLAYSYNEDEGKGLRFREAFNERYVNGIRFVDYNNYKPEDATVSLAILPQLFEGGKLQLLSKIELENLSVSLH
ncbi:DUF6503 family protein [Psychroserpens algicola]|uniref:DUF6503 family protein n=1 Tax=Psychroserpens algicola TaxID=1719034 RepID=UPI0019530232|nr:DUF6503 family protein [Psychroserpens algicola]